MRVILKKSIYFYIVLIAVNTLLFGAADAFPRVSIITDSGQEMSTAIPSTNSGSTYSSRASAEQGLLLMHGLSDLVQGGAPAAHSNVSPIEEVLQSDGSSESIESDQNPLHSSRPKTQPTSVFASRKKTEGVSRHSSFSVLTVKNIKDLRRELTNAKDMLTTALSKQEDSTTALEEAKQVFADSVAPIFERAEAFKKQLEELKEAMNTQFEEFAVDQRTQDHQIYRIGEEYQRDFYQLQELFQKLKLSKVSREEVERLEGRLQDFEEKINRVYNCIKEEVLQGAARRKKIEFDIEQQAEFNRIMLDAKQQESLIAIRNEMRDMFKDWQRQLALEQRSSQCMVDDDVASSRLRNDLQAERQDILRMQKPLTDLITQWEKWVQHFQQQEIVGIKVVQNIYQQLRRHDTFLEEIQSKINQSGTELEALIVAQKEKITDLEQRLTALSHSVARPVEEVRENATIAAAADAQPATAVAATANTQVAELETRMRAELDSLHNHKVALWSTSVVVILSSVVLTVFTQSDIVKSWILGRG